ncbi:hypothetical protein HBI56_122770 [Parastagonospora nodorum]|uniref:Uncharacterized protein n=2 Tax=Phaeosphaeria nodorum (strain SN15 / ATCC MYA-4574 / FGSC 10173) TaxID=321614 RepID=A0A7U2I3L8_PHANO|nr:hypothetical protein HBH56_051910 [Parastagonospora nodorum]QRD02136.1 hypothetical protein JI435_051130 [Parastagonospora nodorum SN15]KAH3935358.1 hypothetical protein HBH54_037700 [Parastagonospora nodorum]KAH3948506.1 hypothetical protein HBH53_101460 [Parastagonospora nodorum]KAH3988692.1 hypothetical protein HBH52_026410 [Parastagonospora nodorum]
MPCNCAYSFLMYKTRRKSLSFATKRSPDTVKMTERVTQVIPNKYFNEDKLRTMCIEKFGNDKFELKKKSETNRETGKETKCFVLSAPRRLTNDELLLCKSIKERP